MTQRPAIRVGRSSGSRDPDGLEACRARFLDGSGSLKQPCAARGTQR